MGDGEEETFLLKKKKKKKKKRSWQTLLPPTNTRRKEAQRKGRGFVNGAEHRTKHRRSSVVHPQKRRKERRLKRKKGPGRPRLGAETRGKKKTRRHFPLPRPHSRRGGEEKNEAREAKEEDSGWLSGPMALRITRMPGGGRTAKKKEGR